MRIHAYLAALCFVAYPSISSATTAWSTPGASGDWGTAGNWSPSQVPDASATVDLTDPSNASTSITISSAESVFEFAGTSAYGAITIQSGGSLTGWGTQTTSFRGSGMTLTIQEGGQLKGGSASAQTLRFDTTVDAGGLLTGFTSFLGMDLVLNGTLDPRGGVNGGIALNGSGGGFSLSGSGVVRLDVHGDNSNDNEKFVLANSPAVDFSSLNRIELNPSYSVQVGDTYDLWDINSGETSDITFGSGANVVLTGAPGLALDTANWSSTGVVTVVEDTSSGGDQLTHEISQYGVTWTFNEGVRAGRFITGDWWVIDEGDGVVVSSVSPAPANGQNGSMVNPVSGGAHALDADVRSPESAYDANLLATFPLTLTAGNSLVSSVSRQEESGDWAGGSIDSKAQLRSAAVLTVLVQAPPADAFRPAYTDRDQTIYRASDIDYQKLPALDTTNITLTQPLSYYERGLERPWILFVPDWTGRDVHPHQNMFGYGRRIGGFLSEATLLLVADVPGKEELIRRYVQLGIDYYHTGLNGNADSNYYVAPVIVAGYLLGDTDMQNAFLDDRILSTPRDYPDFYYYADRNDTTVSSIVPAGETWSGHTVFFRNSVHANRGYEHLHPSEWHLTAEGASEVQKDEIYRKDPDTYIHVGTVLTARILGLQTEWAHDATFDMMDRWMDEANTAAEHAVLQQYDPDSIEAIQSSRSAFVDDMWRTYRSCY